jgi:hypothetical protein
VSEPEEKALEEYLLRRSALSMGYKKIYAEAPPPELDRAITARARRALRWIIPGTLAIIAGLTLVVGVNWTVGTWMHAMVDAEKHLKEINKQKAAEAEKERLKLPVAVTIDAKDIQVEVAQEQAKAREAARQKWLAEIEELKKQGKTATAEIEMRRLRANYPETPAQ